MAYNIYIAGHAQDFGQTSSSPFSYVVYNPDGSGGWKRGSAYTRGYNPMSNRYIYVKREGNFIRVGDASTPNLDFDEINYVKSYTYNSSSVTQGGIKYYYKSWYFYFGKLNRDQLGSQDNATIMSILTEIKDGEKRVIDINKSGNYLTFICYYSNLKKPEIVPVDTTYNGETQELNILTPLHTTRSGVFSAIEVGSYTATFTPDSGYTWSDGTTDAVNINWNIVPAPVFVKTAEGTWTKQEQIKVKPIGDIADDYISVDYITLSGKQYINTGFKPNQNTSVEVSYDANTGSNGSTLFFGSSSNWTGASFGIYRNGTAVKIFSNYNTDTDITSYISVASFNGKHIIKKDKNLLYYDGVLKYTHSATTFQSTRNLLIGNTNDYLTSTNYSFKGKYYYLKVWDNGSLIRDLVPVYKISTNKYGLYDKINGTFYGNAGTGEITGPEVEIWKKAKKVFLKTSGGWTLIKVHV